MADIRGGAADIVGPEALRREEAEPERVDIEVAEQDTASEKADNTSIKDVRREGEEQLDNIEVGETFGGDRLLIFFNSVIKLMSIRSSINFCIEKLLFIY